MFATSSTRAGRTVSEGLTAQGMRRRQAPTPWPVRRRSHHRCARMRAQRTVRRQLGTERSRRWRPWSRSRGGAPAAAIRVPRVWRRSWNLTGRTPARSRARPKRFRSLEASRTVPRPGSANTRSSSACRREALTCRSSSPATRSAMGTARDERGISGCPIDRACSRGARGGAVKTSSCRRPFAARCRRFSCDWTLVAVRRWSTRTAPYAAPRRVVGSGPAGGGGCLCVCRWASRCSCGRGRWSWCWCWRPGGGVCSPARFARWRVASGRRRGRWAGLGR